MAAQEKSVLMEASNVLVEMRQAKTDQEQADREFAQMFKDSAAMLEAMWGTRVTHLRRRLALGVPMKAFSLLPLFSQYRGISISDMGDTRELTTRVNGTGEPITIKLESGVAVPSKTGGPIDLKVEALPEMLRLSSTHGDILNRSYVENHIANRTSFIRRANLEDVTHFQPVIRALAPRYDA